MATILFFEFASQILLHSPWRKIKWWEASEKLWHFQGFFLRFEKQICNIEIKNFSCRGKSYFGWSASHIMWLPMTNFREGDNLDELISYKWSKIKWFGWKLDVLSWIRGLRGAHSGRFDHIFLRNFARKHMFAH